MKVLCPNCQQFPRLKIVPGPCSHCQQLIYFTKEKQWKVAERLILFQIANFALFIYNSIEQSQITYLVWLFFVFASIPFLVVFMRKAIAKDQESIRSVSSQEYEEILKNLPSPLIGAAKSWFFVSSLPTLLLFYSSQMTSEPADHLIFNLQDLIPFVIFSPMLPISILFRMRKLRLHKKQLKQEHD